MKYSTDLLDVEKGNFRYKKKLMKLKQYDTTILF